MANMFTRSGTAAVNNRLLSKRRCWHRSSPSPHTFICDNHNPLYACTWCCNDRPDVQEMCKLTLTIVVVDK